MRRLVCVSVLAVMALLPVANTAAREGEAQRGDHRQEIEAFENGLRPAYGLEGEEEILWTLEERMKLHDVPAISIAVAIDGRLAWARAYGVADKADGRVVNTDTLFQAASLSKPVASLAGLALVQDGQMALDQPINEVLKRWKVPSNKYTMDHPVTLRHLMSHRAGTTIHGFRGYEADAAIPTLAQILDGAKPANTDPVIVNQRPGAAYRYSGGGFTVMQLAIEDSMGIGFADLVENRIFYPAGLTRSNFDYPSRDTNIAIGHRGDGSQSMTGEMLVYPELAAAGLWTTPTELVMLGSLLADARREGNFIIERDLARQLVPDSAQDNGLGFGLNNPGDGVAFVHSGHNPGYSARWINYANGRASVAILTNSDTGGQLIREVLSGLGAIYGWKQDAYEKRSVAKLSRAELTQTTGRYAFRADDDDAIITISADGDALWVEGALLDRARLYPESSSRLFVIDGLNFEVERAADGAVSALIIQDEIRLIKL